MAAVKIAARRWTWIVHRSKLPMHLTPRCGARTRSGNSCRAPAMPTGRCRMHGRPSPGAPKGNKNAFGDTLGDTEGFDRTSEFGAKGDCPTKCPIGTLGTVGRGAAGASSVEYCGRQAYDAAQAA